MRGKRILLQAGVKSSEKFTTRRKTLVFENLRNPLAFVQRQITSILYIIYHRCWWLEYCPYPSSILCAKSQKETKPVRQVVDRFDECWGSSLISISARFPVKTKTEGFMTATVNVMQSAALIMLQSPNRKHIMHELSMDICNRLVEFAGIRVNAGEGKATGRFHCAVVVVLCW